MLTMVAMLSLTVSQAQESKDVKKDCQKECQKDCCKQGEKKDCCKQEGKDMKKKPRMQMTPEQRTERMSKKLGLTGEQKAKVQALNTEYADVLKEPGMRGPHAHKSAATDGTTGATEQKAPQQAGQDEQHQRPQLTEEQRSQMRQNMEKRKEYEGKLKEVLTEEQYKEYQKMSPRPGRHGHHGNGPKAMKGPRQEDKD